MFNLLINRVVKEPNTDYWLSVEAFNLLIRNAMETRLTESGILELWFPGNFVGISFKTSVFYKEADGSLKKSDAQIVYTKNYTAPKGIPEKEKFCKIL